MTSESTRQSIVETAAELFWARSYHGVGVAQIAAATKVNKATLYQHFRSKDELAQAVVTYNLERTVDCVFEAAMAASEDPDERLEGIYRRVHAMHVSLERSGAPARGCPFVNIAMELSLENDSLREQVADAIERFAGYYRTIVRSLPGRKLRKAEVDARASALVGNMNGAMVASKYQGRPAAILEALPTALLILHR